MMEYVEVIKWTNLISPVQKTEDLELALLELTTAHMKKEI